MQLSSSATTFLAYCGAPPDPGLLWSRWRLDPILLGLMCAIGFAYALARSRTRVANSRLFYLGWLIAAFALVSPLCALSVSLFSARVSQHVLLTLLAAPLIACGRPLKTLVAAAFPHGESAQRSALDTEHGRAGAPLAAAGIFASCVWFWHVPGPYAATFESWTVYWAMHVSMFAAALWLWSELLTSSQTAPWSRLLAGIATALQMGLLGALLTLAPRPLFSPHFLTTDAWGLTPLQDQQLGGVIMWVPGCAVFLAVAMIDCARMFARAAQRPSHAAHGARHS